MFNEVISELKLKQITINKYLFLIYKKYIHKYSTRVLDNNKIQPCLRIRNTLKFMLFDFIIFWRAFTRLKYKIIKHTKKTGKRRRRKKGECHFYFCIIAVIFKRKTFKYLFNF